MAVDSAADTSSFALLTQIQSADAALSFLGKRGGVFESDDRASEPTALTHPPPQRSAQPAK